MAPAPCLRFFLFTLLASEGVFSQPLFFIGKADARLQGAFSYTYLKSPLDYPADVGEVEAIFNLPVNLAGNAQKAFGSASDSSFVVPSIFGHVSQMLNAGISASAPVGPGVLFFAARENAGLEVTAALGDASFNLDTTLSAGYLRLKGSVYLPVRLDLSWRSLTLGYALQATPWLRLGMQVHRHEIMAKVGGDLRPDLVGRIEASGVAFDVAYTENQVYGNATGSFHGVAYTPEMAVQAGPVRWVARMPTSLRAQGQLDMDYRLPFFIDAETFSPTITVPDSFLAPENLRRLLNGETNARQWVFREPLRFTLPGSQTLAWEFWNNRLELSYTEMFGSLGVHSEPVGGDTDSVSLRSQGYLNANVTPNHLLLFRWETDFFRGCVGANTVNAAYHGKTGLLTGFSPLQINGDPIAPVLQFGFLWGNPLRFNLDFTLTPLPSIRSGARYRF